MGLALAALLFLVIPAFAHDHWVRNYSNGNSNCCGKDDIAFIEHSLANSLQIGSIATVDFPNYKGFPVTVLKIYQTEDVQGRAIITRYGCLFINNGM